MHDDECTRYLASLTAEELTINDRHSYFHRRYLHDSVVRNFSVDELRNVWPSTTPADEMESASTEPTGRPESTARRKSSFME